MGFFKRDKAEVPAPSGEREVLQPMYQPTEAPAAERPANPNEVDAAKTTAEQIVSDLKINADHQSVTAKRVAGLAMTISKMEAGLRHMGRLETQCAKLEDELNGLQKRYAQKDNWATEQERKLLNLCLLYTSPSPRDRQKSRMPSSA